MQTKSNFTHETRRRLLSAFVLLTLLLLTSVAASAQAPIIYDAPERLVIKSQVLG